MVRNTIIGVMVIVIFLFFIPALGVAEPISVKASGEYILGDNDTFAEAKSLALQQAKRNALEKVGTYLESASEVKNFMLTQDEITAYAAAFIKIEDISEKRFPVGDKAMAVQVDVVAIIDSTDLSKKIEKFRKRKDYDDIISQWKKEYVQLRKELAELSQELKKVTDAKQVALLRDKRLDAVERIEKSEKGFTVLMSGSKLYASAALEKEQLEADKQTIRTFLKELASAYEIKANEPESELNVYGTADLIVTGEIILPGKYDTLPYELPVPSFSKMREIGITFSRENKTLDYSKYRLKGKKVYTSFPHNTDNHRVKLAAEYLKAQLREIFIELKSGTHSKRINVHSLINDFYGCTIPTWHQFRAELCSIPLDELKTMNSVDIKVIYKEPASF